MHNMGYLLEKIKDYERALGHYQQALRGYEKVFGKTEEKVALEKVYPESGL